MALRCDPGDHGINRGLSPIFPKGDRRQRRQKEQQAINDRGGVDGLDNRRNEVAEKKWDDYGVRPPGE
jgi:hypothetical protein